MVINRCKVIVGNLFSKNIITRLHAKLVERPISLSDKNVFKKQQVLLDKILHAAIEHTEYYRCRFINTCHVSINDFPIVDKHIISEHFNDFVSDIAQNYCYSDACTGGSTGEPFHFFISGGFEHEFGEKRWISYGYKKGELILALDGTKIEEELLSKRIYWKKKSGKDLPFGSWALSSLYLNEKTALIYCSYIFNLKPDYIRGYPSFVYEIACHAERMIIDVGSSVKAIELTSETAYEYQIEKIKKVFHAKVYLQYGHTEACVCANTFDDTYKYKVEPLYGYVEILDKNNNHVKEGEVGELVVTTLHNRVMPLIRYRTGDMAEYGGKDDRFLYLNKVMGRSQDYLINRNKEKVLLTALIFAQHLIALGHIYKWQLEQFEPGIVVAYIIKGVGYTSNDEKEIEKLFNDIGNINVKINYVESIILTPRGKSKLLVQHLNF